jgi:hypothetical protein
MVIEHRVEHFILRDSHLYNVVDWLNDRAKEGWRLIAVDAGIYFFERETEQPATNGVRGKNRDGC